MNKKGVNSPSFKDKTGEKHITNEGYEIQIIEYLGTYKCNIQFKDGTILNNLSYHNILNGSVRKPKLGNIYITREGYEITIVEYKDRFNCTVEFKNGYRLEDTSLQNVKNGLIKNPYHPTIYNIGYLGNGEYKSSIFGENTYLYKTWRSMFSRCYDKKIHERQPNYKDVTVCEEWHNFQNFAKWMENKYNPETMQSWHLDKDILIKGNKIYSPETCCFVPKIINSLLILGKRNRGDCPIGLTKKGNRYEVRVSNIFRKEYKGTYDSIEEAFNIYKIEKEKYIKEVAEGWKDKIDSKVYQALINYQVEITD